MYPHPQLEDFWALSSRTALLIHYPPLTVLVVSEVSGMLGVGFIAAENVPQAQADVFRFDWVARGAPSPDNFSEAHNAQA